jgi:hypothetical protein
MRASKIYKAYRGRTSDAFRTIAGMAATAPPLILTFALFRSDSLGAFWRLLHIAAAGGPAPATPLSVGASDWAPIAAAALIVYLTPNIYELLRNYRPGIRAFTNPSRTVPVLRLAWRPSLMWALYLAAVGVAAFLRLNHRAAFLYAGF